MQKTSKVTPMTNDFIKVTWDPRHRAALIKEEHNSLAYDIGLFVKSHCPLQWESWRAVLANIKERFFMSYELVFSTSIINFLIK